MQQHEGKAAEKQPELSGAVLNSVTQVKLLVSDIIKYLTLKGRQFQVFPAASQQDIEDIWSSLHSIDVTLNHEEK